MKQVSQLSTTCAKINAQANAKIPNMCLKKFKKSYNSIAIYDDVLPSFHVLLKQELMQIFLKTGLDNHENVLVCPSLL